MKCFGLRVRIALFLTIAIITLVPSIVLGSEGPGSNHLKIGTLAFGDALPVLVAEENGYFDEEGLDVEIVYFGSAHERDSALMAGKIDAQLSDLVITVSLEAAGADVAVTSLLLGATPEEGIIAILAAPNSGIDVVEDLKGVPIAVSNNSLIEYTVDKLLTGEGFKPGEINKIEVAKIPLRYQMLMTSQVKAACLPDPLASLAEKQGARRIIDDTTENISQSVILFREEVLDSRPEQVRAFHRAYEKAVREVNANSPAYADLMVNKLRLPDELKDDYRYDNFPLPQAPREADVQAVVDWMFEKGLIKKKVQYEDVVRPEFLP